MELSAFLDLLTGVQHYQGGSNARCPAHDDGTASLSVSPGDDGGIVVNCHAGCDTADVLKVMGLSFADLGALPHKVAEYHYTDSQNRVLWTVERWASPKTFRCRPGLPLKSKRVLYGASWIAKARAENRPILVVEGEKDADRAHAENIPATTCVLGAGSWLPHYSDELAGLDVLVVADNDPAGKRHAQAIYKSLDGIAASVRLLKSRSGSDLSDHFDAGFTVDDLDPLGWGGRMPCYRGTDLVDEPVRWAWAGHMPLGAITVIDGDPGDGKSVLTCELAARWSSHLRMPDGSANPFDGPVNVIMVCAEDHLKATVAPRLRAHGADMSRMHLINMGNEEGAPFSLGVNLGDLEEVIAEHQAKIIVLDPVMAYLPDGTDSASDMSVRRALAPLMLLAARHDVLIIVVRHLNKSGHGKAIYRGGGSIAFSGLARAAFLVARHPDDESARVLAAVKASLAPAPPSLVYRISTDPVRNVARLDWAGQLGAGAQELLDGDGEHDSPPGEVAGWLMGLCTEPMPWKEIVTHGKNAGYTEKSLMRVRSRVLEKVFGPGGNRDVTWRAKFGLTRGPFDRGLDLVPTYPPEMADGGQVGNPAMTSGNTDPDGSLFPLSHLAVVPQEGGVSHSDTPAKCDQCGQGPAASFTRADGSVTRCRAHHPDLFKGATP